ncbi:hypothetical protein [Sphingobium yanoikuyae]|uniref:hypothetical protein n=1 Tax=Sphingobium yanoikuyae TaxID=13690 RepID=UPI0035C70DB3
MKQSIIENAADAAMHAAFSDITLPVQVSITGKPEDVRKFWVAIASAAIRSSEGKVSKR